MKYDVRLWKDDDAFAVNLLQRMNDYTVDTSSFEELFATVGSAGTDQFTESQQEFMKASRTIKWAISCGVTFL